METSHFVKWKNFEYVTENIGKRLIRNVLSKYTRRDVVLDLSKILPQTKIVARLLSCILLFLLAPILS